MSKTKLLYIAVVALFLLNIGTLTYIFTRKPPRHHQLGDEGPKQIIIDRLHFDNKQEKEYSLIVEEHRAKSRELNGLSRSLHNSLYSLLSEKIFNKEKADSLINQIAINQKAIDNLNLDHFQKIKSICKDNQTGFFNELVKDLTHLFSPHPQKK
ncbi:MAG: hypothetical protein SFY56_12710 [Bacteroidota bacterium]|nr:hypothetical protein [Bacteroidota bacterium]